MRFGSAIALLAFSLAGLPLRADQIDFARDVRPILAGRCFKCHGPDEAQRQAGLRLDVRESATAEADSGLRAVVPGRPDESELVRRIFSEDRSEIMPPAHAKNPLTAAQKEILRRWIAAGAEYEPHWAFIAPQRPPLPEVRDAEWSRNPIDRFVLARLEREGLAPSPPADGYTLIRRVYLDLIGLPPTPEEADAFVNDDSPEAYERLINRLLASPHYGERWARRWLDLARYADTNGYEKDRPRSIWPYRDWVINALNAGMPFDQFTIEQLAGDMLPDGTLEQTIATGFHRNTMINEEGGIDPLEFRYYAVVDRINTTATTWLGLTLGCAQCHTHKYDPIQHREYYAMLAFLNNADEPELEVPTPELAARRAELESRIAALEAELPSRFPLPEYVVADDTRTDDEVRRDHIESRFEEWLARESEQAVAWTLMRPVRAEANLPKLEILDDGSVLASGDQTKRDMYGVTFRGDFEGVTAIRLEVLPHESLPKSGPGRAYYEGPKGDFFLSELTLSADGERVPISGASESYAKLGIGGGGASASMALDGVAHSGWSTSGREGEAHTAVFNLAEPLKKCDTLSLELLFDRHYPAGLGRFRVWATTAPGAVRAGEMPTKIEQLLLEYRLQPAADSLKAELQRYFLSVAPELAKAREEMEKLRKQLPAYPTTLVMQERPADNPRETHRHHRGEFLQPDEPVEPGVLSILHPLPEGAPRSRLTFARWLVDPRNPLVGRVTMNRQWSAFFGGGLVRTVEDFGFQGELPTHPELLDWLATEFIRRGWSLKEMHRLIVTSATYRQSSRVTPELLRRDPENRLLARGPRFRIEAESVRDAALASAGLLSRQLGGPSVFPPQPASVTTEGAYGKLQWKTSEGLDRHRRGLYTFSKRTTPYAMFTTFDAPSGEACVARREVSNTPLQALTILNDTVFAEASQALGDWTARQPESLDTRERMRTVFRRILVREPDDEELSMLVRFLEEQRERLREGELDPAKIAGSGEGDAVDRAAWTLVARALQNTDEAVTKR